MKHDRRRLRKNLTPAEKILWNALRNRKLNGIKFTRQHSISLFVTDFYSAAKKLAIELDGKIHLKKDVADYDKQREEFIEAWGIKILRFKNEEIIERLPMVLEKIKNCF